MNALTRRQKEFTLDYIESGNATRSYLKVYNVKSEKAAHSAGSRLLRNDRIRALIDAHSKSVQARHDVNIDMIILELSRLGFSDMANYAHFDGKTLEFKNLEDLTPDQTRAIQSIEQVVKMDEGGNTITTTKFKLHSKHGPLVDLGKHFGMFKDKGESSNKTINVFNGLTILNSSNQPKEEPQAIEVKGEEVVKSKGLQIVKAPEKGE